MNLKKLVDLGADVLNNELEKSLDMIILNWMSKGFYTDMTEGEMRKSISALLEPMLEDIKKVENDIHMNQSYGMGDTDEMMMELSRKKMNFIRKVSELSRTI
jgi:S-ribosylhomocysteine lyase LuxS involved in autoinducer biosynthesis